MPDTLFPTNGEAESAGMRLSLILFILLVFIAFANGQSVIPVAPGPVDHSNTDGPVTDTYTVDISDCSSISFSLDYSFNLAWEGPDNMEYSAECGGCAGDVNDPTSGGCDNCWDFMWIQYIMDGNSLEELIIGDAGTTDAEQFGSFMSAVYCTDGIEEAEISITNQNWAATETNSYSNVIILCWEGIPEIVTNDPICGSDDLELDGTAGDESVVTGWEWTNDGSGVIDNPDAQNTFATMPEDGEEYTLTTTDENACLSSSTVSVSIEEVPEIFPAGPLEICDIFNDNEESFDLTVLDDIISNGIGTVLWFEDMALNNPIGDPTDFLSPETSVYAVVEMNGCQSLTEEIMLELLENPEPEAVANFDFFCIGEGIDLELDEVGDFGDAWLWSGPDGFSSTLQDPTLVITSTAQSGTYIVTVTDISGNCTATSSVDIVVGESPAVQATASATTVCAGADIQLNETGGEALSWMWTGPNGFSSPLQNPLINGIDANGAGDYVVVVSDMAGCTASDMITINVGSIDAAMAGGADLCINQCTDTDTDLYFLLSGGTSPYSVNMAVNSIPLPGFSIDIDQTVRICHDEDLVFPELDQSGDPVIINLPDGAFPLQLELLSITDDSGCSAMIDPDSSSINLNLLNPPSINEPDPGIFCVNPGQTVNLTVMEDEITGGDNTLDVRWFADMGLQNELPDPSSYDYTQGLTVYAVTDNGSCFSEVIEVMLEVFPYPVIQSDTLLTGCFDLYELPDPEDIADIQNANNPVYFLDALLIDGPYTAGSMIDPEGLTEIFIFDSNGPCDAVESVPIMIDIPPVIISPENELTGCGTILLPDPEVEGTVSAIEYNSVSDGSGISYDVDDRIDADDSLDVIYLIVTGEGACSTTLEIDLQIDSSINFSAAILPENCGDVILPPITPATVDVAYFSEPGGQGEILLPGDTLFAIADSLLNYELYIFDPTLDSMCASEVALSFSIEQGPEIDLAGDTLGCDHFILPVITGEAINAPVYSTEVSRDSSFFLNPGDSIFSDQLIYIMDTLGSCIYLDSININIIPVPYIGMDAQLSICAGFDIYTIDLMEMIGNPDTGGNWSYPNIPDFDPADSTDVDLGPIPPGNFSFVYGIEDSCGLNTTLFELEVIAPPFAGMDSILSICSSDEPQNFMELLSGPQLTGRWRQVGGPAMIDISDSTSVSFNSALPGDYAFTYTIAASVQGILCDAQAASLVIKVVEGPEAGMNIQTSACIGDILDLNDLLDSEADTGGVFEPLGFLLTGNVWNTSASQANQSYTVNYIIESQALNCPSDTAFIEIFLAEEITAGTPQPVNGVCAGESIMLNDFLIDETPGGSFTLADDPENPVPVEWTADSTRTFEYFIGGSEGCPDDSVEFTVVVNPLPELNFNQGDLSLCAEDGCTQIELQSNGWVAADLELMNETDNTLFPVSLPVNMELQLVICPFGNEGTLSINADTLFLGDQGAIYSLATVELMDIVTYCTEEMPATPVFQIEIFPGFSEVIDFTLCPGDSALYNGNYYRDSDTLMFSSINGCDSTVFLDIGFYPQETASIMEDLCEGESYTIFGMNFSEDTDTVLVMEGGSVFGCDSIVDVVLDFESVVFGSLTPVLCPGESLQLEDQSFDMDNPEGEVLIPGGSVNGCDSIVIVELSFYNESVFNLQQAICEGESIMVGNDIYNADQPQGTTILSNQAESNCDSIVEVDLEILSLSYNLINTVFCEDSSLVINGTTYNIDNPTGMEILPGANAVGCDSIIEIDLSYDIADAEFELLDACPGENNGEFQLQSVTGLQLPLTLILNEQEIGIVSSVPYLLDLDPGSYELELISNDCIYMDQFAIEITDTTGFGIEIIPVSTNSFQLAATGPEIINYSWDSNAELSCYDCPVTSLSISQNSTVSLLAETASGCLLSSDIVLPYTPVVNYYIPNIIDFDSPDNDKFYIQSNFAGSVVEEMQIFDRWGNLIFDAMNVPVNEPDAGWNGLKDNKPVEQGVYLYLLKLRNTEGELEIRTGDITILR